MALNLLQQEKLSKKQRRIERQRKKQGNAINPNTLVTFKQSFVEVQPRTEAQGRAFDAYDNGKNIVMHGSAGTGKTFLALYLALDSVVMEQEYERVVLMRSVVPTRDIGFMPGTLKDKTKMYESPYQTICSELFRRGDAYELLKSKNFVEFSVTSFIRGNTIDNAIVIIDEAQNLTGHEIYSVITRLGENSRLIVCGDVRQSDLKYDAEKRGIKEFLDIAQRIPSFELIRFNEEDIVRSQLVKDYIIACNNYRDEQYAQSGPQFITEQKTISQTRIR